MKEVEANDFDFSTVHEKFDSALGLRVLLKEGKNHISEVPDSESSLYVSSKFRLSDDTWQKIADIINKGEYNAKPSAKGVAIW